MTFSVNAISDVTAVIKVGEVLDSRTATEFKSVSRDQIRCGVRNIVLDFTDTGSVDSTGLGSLYTLYRNISAVGGKVYVASLSAYVWKTFVLTHTYRVFRSFISVDDACRAISDCSYSRSDSMRISRTPVLVAA